MGTSGSQMLLNTGSLEESVWWAEGYEASEENENPEIPAREGWLWMGDWALQEHLETIGQKHNCKFLLMFSMWDLQCGF